MHDGSYFWKWAGLAPSQPNSATYGFLLEPERFGAPELLLALTEDRERALTRLDFAYMMLLRRQHLCIDELDWPWTGVRCKRADII